MRRKDREITSFDEQLKIIDACDVCRLGLVDDEDYPYILPLNFGYEVIDNELVLYFHGALEGYKYELIDKNNKASFELDCNHDLYSNREIGYCTMNYSSIMGKGVVEYVTDQQEKFKALTVMTDKYHMDHFEFNPKAIPRTRVFKLTVTSMTAKHKEMKK